MLNTMASPLKKKPKILTAQVFENVNKITEIDIRIYRNTQFDNMALSLLTSGHRKSFEFLEEIVLKDQSFSGNLINDIDSLNILKDFFIKAEDLSRDGRFNRVSMAYVEAAACPTFQSLFWLQELIIERALKAAEKYKADGGKQLAYCQLLLSQMLESTKVRNLKSKNMIFGTEYKVKAPSKCITLLTSCLSNSIGRSHWTSPENHIPFELISAGHLARVKLANNLENEENVKQVVKLAEQAGSIWLECLSNYYLSKILFKNVDRYLEASIRLERALSVLNKNGHNHQDDSSPSIWSNDTTCMQAPSYARLAGMCTVFLCQIKLTNKTVKAAEQCINLLQDYLNNWQEVSDERANALNLLGNIYDRNFNNPENALSCYNESYKIKPESNTSRSSIGIASSHMYLDSIMRLLNTSTTGFGSSEYQLPENVASASNINLLTMNKNSNRYKTSKRLLVWKDEPEQWQHDLDSD